MERVIAKNLLEIGAVSLRVDPPFTWASGRLSPIYCDNRLLMSYPEKRRQATDGFVEMIKTRGWSPDVIAGTATAAHSVELEEYHAVVAHHRQADIAKGGPVLRPGHGEPVAVGFVALRLAVSDPFLFRFAVAAPR